MEGLAGLAEFVCFCSPNSYSLGRYVYQLILMPCQLCDCLFCSPYPYSLGRYVYRMILMQQQPKSARCMEAEGRKEEAGKRRKEEQSTMHASIHLVLLACSFLLPAQEKRLYFC